MLRVDVVRRVDTATDWEYEENPLLRRIIEWVLQEPLEDFVRRILVETCRRIGKSELEAKNFWVRVAHSDKPELGCCFHRNRETGELGAIPDMHVGFANDVLDFAESIIHEALHALGWSEEATEAKAKEIAAGTIVGDY